MTASKGVLNTIIRWLLVLIITMWIVYVVPPKGVDNVKFLISFISGIGIALAGVLQFRMLRATPPQPLKAIGLGAGLRALIVVGAIVMAKLFFPPEFLTGTAISVLIVYFAVQLVEMPTLVKIVSGTKS